MPPYARHQIISPSQPAPEPRTIDRTITLAGRPPAQLMRILRERIEQLDKETDSRYCLEYCAAHFEGGDTPIREGYRWVGIFPVTGGSEGHYLHLVAIYQQDDKGHSLRANDYREIGTIKLFGGWDAAAELAGIIGKWMDA